MTDPHTIMTEGSDTFKKKREDYGMSWRWVGYILYMLAEGEPVVLETPEDHTAYGLYTRRLDKFSRAFNLEFNQDSENFESAVDSHKDALVYASMSASNLESDGFERGNIQFGDRDREEDTGESGILGAVTRLSTAARKVFSY